MSTTNKLPSTVACAINEQQSAVWRLRSLLECMVYAVANDLEVDIDAALGGVIEMADKIHLALDAGVLADRVAELQEDDAQRDAFVTGEGSAEADDRNVASERINAERKRIFQAMGIVESVAAGMGRQVQANDPGYPFALDAAAVLLNDIAEKMELIGTDRDDDDEGGALS